MRKKQTSVVLLFGLIAVAFQNCSKKDNAGEAPSYYDAAVTSVLNLPNAPYNYVVSFPSHIAAALTSTDNTPANNQLTNDGATLGRVLFYDKNLSRNKTISCGSCHQQAFSFDDTAIKSKGFAGGSTRRHSMPLLNVRFYQSGKMFWDERAASLEAQVLMPIQDATEMGMTLQQLLDTVKAKPYYPQLFQKAFGSTEITTDKISKALAQFVRSIVTYQSKYDRVKQGIESFTLLEQQGETLFNTAPPGPPPPPGAPARLSCNSCHTAPMFLTSTPGGPFQLVDSTDLGINNEGRFKSVSLRNVAMIAPHFHNGSVSNLTQVLSTNIPAHNVPAADLNKFLAFLQTLSDNTVLTDPKFSNPFR
jgi:cytochrome c peroxidase